MRDAFQSGPFGARFAAILVALLAAVPLFAVPLSGATAGAILTVGASGADYTTISAAVQFADNHADVYYTIEIAPGIYVNDFSIVTTPMTIKAAAGGPVVLDATIAPTNGKAIITTSASATIIGLTFQGAAVGSALGSNGAGVRAQAGTAWLIVENSVFINNQDGVLADADAAGNISISGSSFFSNGFDAGGGACPSTGCDHAVYVGAVNSLLVTDSLFCGTILGHDVKSRAAVTTIANNRLYDGAADSAIGCAAGSTSYAVDVANGGVATISGNSIIQGAGSENRTMIAYGAEGLRYAANALLVSNNSFVSAGVANAIGISDAPCVPAQLQGNRFQGVATPVNPARCAVFIDHAVPEPNGALLLLVGLMGCALLRVLRTAPKPATA